MCHHEPLMQPEAGVAFQRTSPSYDPEEGPHVLRPALGSLLETGWQMPAKLGLLCPAGLPRAPRPGRHLLRQWASLPWQGPGGLWWALGKARPPAQGQDGLHVVLATAEASLVPGWGQARRLGVGRALRKQGQMRPRCAKGTGGLREPGCVGPS